MPNDVRFATTVGGRHLADLVRKSDPEGGVEADNKRLTVIQEVLRATRAQEAIQNRWLQLNGARSDVGLPLDAAFPVRKEGNRYIVDYRGGTMQVMENDPGNVIINPSPRVAIIFKGMGLEMRQETEGDELYGNISVAIGAIQSLNHITIPIINLGPGDDFRIYETNEVVFEGRPNDVNLVVKLFEHDEGNQDEIRAIIRKRVEDATKTGLSIVGGGIGGATGEALTALNRDQNVSGGLYEWLRNGLADGIHKLLGLGDDEYNGATLNIPYGDMMRIPPTRVYRCWDDPRAIEFTHSLTVSGEDDGGDRGKVTLLFKVVQV